MSASPSLRAFTLPLGATLLLGVSGFVPAYGAPQGDDASVNAPSASPEPSSTRRKVRLHVIGPDERPVPGAKINVSVWSPSKFRPAKSHSTDAGGAVEMELPQQLRIVRFWVSADKLVSMFVHWEERDEPEKSLPAEVTIPLENGTTIGGYVVDEDDKPIPGAKVEVRLSSTSGRKSESQRIAYATHLATENDALYTDADGRWKLDDVPAADDIEVRVEVSHSDYISDPNAGSLQQKQGIDLAALRRGDSRLVMPRGIALSGTITDPDGKPIPGAAVIWSDRREMSGGTQVVRTDLQGKFRSTPMPAGKVPVMVLARNWMPQLKEIELTKDTGPIDFQMRPGKRLRLRFVDNKGQPVRDVLVYARRWRGKEMMFNGQGGDVIAAEITRRANDAGIYEWNWAPDDAVTCEIRVDGFADLEPSLVANDSEQTIVLSPHLIVTGNVTDAENGAPVESLSAVQVHYFSPDFLYVNRDEKVDGKGGKFRMQFERTDVEHGVRIEADGYRTKLVGPWKIGDPNPQIEVKLQRAPNVAGAVVDSEGRPVRGARVFLGTHTQHTDIVNHEDRSFSDTYVRETSAHGTFAFPAQYEPYELIAIHDGGYAEQRRNSDEQPGPLKLRPWAKVQGRVSDNGKSVPGVQVRFDPIRARFFPEPRIDDNFWQRTDKEGRFVFERVPPVKCSLSAYLTVWDEFPIRSSESVPLDLQPGEERTVELGGEGVTVVGRVKPTGETTREIDLNYSLNYLLRMTPGIDPTDLIARAGFDWRKGWTEAFTSTEEGRLYLATLNYHFVKLGRDGTFHISGVRPGNYELAVKVYETPEGCLVNPVGTKIVKFKVQAEDLLEPRVDLGNIEIAASLGPQVGEAVADFEFETLDGGRQRLSELRGKYVLLDAWATWCGSCVGKLPLVKQLHEKYGADGQLAVVSLSLDADKNLARQYVREHQLDWTHGFLGDWSSTDVPSRLGISSVPVYFILDREGQLLWRGFSADEIEKQLSNVMPAAK